MSISGPYRACHAHPYGGKTLLHAFLRVPLSVQAPGKSVQRRDRDSFGWGTTLLYIVGSSVRSRQRPPLRAAEEFIR
jgi:hypothetical protein